jgi:hypothetical protein
MVTLYSTIYMHTSYQSIVNIGKYRHTLHWVVTHLLYTICYQAVRQVKIGRAHSGHIAAQWVNLRHCQIFGYNPLLQSFPIDK